MAHVQLNYHIGNHVYNNGIIFRRPMKFI